MAEPDGLTSGAQSYSGVDAPADQHEQPTAAQPTRFLRLRGLPFSCSEADITAFFHQFELSQVFICKRNGRSNGEAFVELADPSQTQTALAQLNRQHIGPRYVELFEASASDLITAKALTVDRLRGYVIRMRGLPYTASAADVLRFLDGVEVVRGMEGVIFTWTPDGRPTGEAFVELKDEAAQAEAMKKHKELMGTRYIELFTSTKAALVQAIQHNRLILGFTNRRRWLQQPGPSGPVLVPQQPGLQSMLGQHIGHGVEDISDGFAGMTMQDSHGMRGGVTSVIRQGGGVAVGQGGALVMQPGPGNPGVMGARPDMQPRGGHAFAQPATMRNVQAGQQVMQSYLPGQGQLGQQHIAQQQGYGSLQLAGPSVVVQQPYIIQQASNQYINMGGNAGYSGIRTLVDQPTESGPRQQQQGQYMNVAGQGYTVQTIQLPAGSNIQDYLQLTSAHGVDGQAGTTYMATNLQTINMPGLGQQVHSQESSQQGSTLHMLHQ